MIQGPSFSKAALFVLVGLTSQVAFTGAFTPASISKQAFTAYKGNAHVLYSSKNPEEEPVAPVASAPPPVPPKRMDPLMATLTRSDPSKEGGPTKKVPLFGEVPVDGGLTVLVPAAVIAILGFVFSIVVAFNSGDQLVNALNNVSSDIAQTATQQPNKVYDENVCRGLCSSQAKDLDNLRGFMESLGK